jgi:hypothetical protein
MLLVPILLEHKQCLFAEPGKSSVRDRIVGARTLPRIGKTLPNLLGNQIRSTQVSEMGAVGNMYVDALPVNGGPLPGFQRYSNT